MQEQLMKNPNDPGITVTNARALDVVSWFEMDNRGGFNKNIVNFLNVK